MTTGNGHRSSKVYFILYVLQYLAAREENIKEEST